MTVMVEGFWRILGALGTVFVVTAGGTWSLAKMTQANELDAYKAAKDWKAAEAIEALRQAAETAAFSAEERKQFVELQAARPRLESELVAARSELETLSREVVGLRRTVAAQGKPIVEVEVPEGETRFVIPQALLVGVRNAAPYAKACDVRIGDKSERLEIAQSLSIKHAGTLYALTLQAVLHGSCKFIFASQGKG